MELTRKNPWQLKKKPNQSFSLDPLIDSQLNFSSASLLERKMGGVLKARFLFPSCSVWGDGDVNEVMCSRAT